MTKEEVLRLRKVAQENPELTDAQLAERFGVSATTISNVKRRKTHTRIEVIRPKVAGIRYTSKAIRSLERKAL